MELRQLKEEIQSLPSIEENVRKFQEQWLKPLRSHTNIHLPFLFNLSLETKKELNKKIAAFQEILRYLKYSQHVQEKLRSYAHHLIELKLTSFNGDYRKARMIAHNFLRDESFQLKKTIRDIISCEQAAREMAHRYKEINEFLQKKLRLEDSLYFMELPHKKYVQIVLKTTEKQKSLVHLLGKEFVGLVKQTMHKKANGKMRW